MRRSFFAEILLENGQVNGILIATKAREAMKMFRKISIILLAVMLVLAGCSKAAQQTGQTPDKPQSIGLCVRNRADAPEYYAALETSLQEMGFTLVVEDSLNDQSRQDEKVRSMVEQGCKLLIVEPVMVTALDMVISTAQGADIPVLLMDREPEEAVLNAYEKLYYVGCRIENAGAWQAALLEDLNLRGDLNGDGMVSCMILRGPEDSLDAQIITEGCVQILENTETEILCTEATQWTLEDGRAKCAQALKKYGKDLEVILCNDTRLALGAVEAVKNGGWTPGQDVYILAVGCDTELTQALQQGTVAGTVWADTRQRIELVTRTAQMLLAGESVERRSYVEYAPWTKD